MGKKKWNQKKSRVYTLSPERGKSFEESSRKEPSGQCIHCLGFFENLTRDHVCPESWYPLEYPDNLLKPTVPSCPVCNHKFGNIENRLKNQIGLCLDPGDPLGRHIWQSAMRSVNPYMGTTVRDVTHRFQKWESMRRKILSGDEIPEKSLYPGFGITPGIPKKYQGAIRISSDDMIAFTEKVIRGVTFLQNGRLIELPFHIESHAVDASKAAPVEELLQIYGQECGPGPFFSVVRALCEDGTTSIFRMVIWGRLVRYGCVTASRNGINLCA